MAESSNLRKSSLPQPVRRIGKPVKAWCQRVVRSATAWLARPNLYRPDTRERVGVVYTASTHLSIPERLFLYSLVRGTRPDRVLEIGSAFGGSASIMAAALEDNGRGVIVGVDPLRRLDPGDKAFHGRFRLVESAAPEGFGPAREQAGGTFQLVFYDGPNVYEQACRILESLVPHLADRAFVALDNGYHFGVHQAARDLMTSNPRFHDCGFVCTDVGVRDQYAAYHGLRLLRYDIDAISDPQPRIDAAYASAGKPAPRFDPATLNHDGWWCRTVKACPKCEESGGKARLETPGMDHARNAWLR